MPAPANDSPVRQARDVVQKKWKAKTLRKKTPEEE